jgi:hypothetical protein
VIIDQEFPTTLKNVVGNWDWDEKTTLGDNLKPLQNAVSVFANIARDIDHADAPPVTVGFSRSSSPQQVFSYSDFICLNDGSLLLGSEDQDDGDTTFWFQTDTGQIARQPAFFDPAFSNELQIEIEQKLKGPIEGEILMFGRSADCGDDGAETATPSFPGWAERTQGSAVLFNGRPIHVVVPADDGGPPSPPNFLTELSFGDPVRVTGALVYDHGHDNNPKKLEVHPVYAVDKITATFSADLSGGWADDVGNTYYLRHDLTDNSVWYVAISPLGYSRYGQVFQGTFHPRQVVAAAAAAPENIGPSPIPPQSAVTGEFAAIGFGSGAPPSGAATTGTRIGDTGAVTFGLGTTRLVGRDVPMLSTGWFRLMKLYDA